MDGLVCDRCGNGLLLDAPVRYEVRLEVKSAYDPLELSDQDLVDATSEMRRLLDTLKDYSAEQAQDEVYRAFRFDLCATCQKLFLKNPLGKPGEDRSSKIEDRGGAAPPSPPGGAGEEG